MNEKAVSMIGKVVIVTGGVGFISSNLAEELAVANSVIIIGNLSAAERIIDILTYSV